MKLTTLPYTFVPDTSAIVNGFLQIGLALADHLERYEIVLLRTVLRELDGLLKSRDAEARHKARTALNWLEQFQAHSKISEAAWLVDTNFTLSINHETDLRLPYRPDRTADDRIIEACRLIGQRNPAEAHPVLFVTYDQVQRSLARARGLELLDTQNPVGLPDGAILLPKYFATRHAHPDSKSALKYCWALPECDGTSRVHLQLDQQYRDNTMTVSGKLEDTVIMEHINFVGPDQIYSSCWVHFNKTGNNLRVQFCPASHLNVERLYSPPHRISLKVAQSEVSSGGRPLLSGLTLIAKIQRANPVELEHYIRALEKDCFNAIQQGQAIITNDSFQ